MIFNDMKIICLPFVLSVFNLQFDLKKVNPYLIRLIVATP